MISADQKKLLRELHAAYIAANDRFALAASIAERVIAAAQEAEAAEAERAEAAWDKFSALASSFGVSAPQAVTIIQAEDEQ